MQPKNILIIDNGSIYLPELKRLFSSSICKIVQPGAIDVPAAENHDMVVLSGGYQHEVMGGEDFYKAEIQLIKNSRIPVVGICLGFQLIAHTFDMPIHKLTHTEHTTLTIHPTRYGSRLLGTGPFHVYEDHRWVVSKAPNGFHALATSKDGIEGLIHKSRPLAGFQFHPEMFVSKNDGRKLLENLMLAIASQHR